MGNIVYTSSAIQCTLNDTKSFKLKYLTANDLEYARLRMNLKTGINLDDDYGRLSIPKYGHAVPSYLMYQIKIGGSSENRIDIFFEEDANGNRNVSIELYKNGVRGQTIGAGITNGITAEIASRTLWTNVTDSSTNFEAYIIPCFIDYADNNQNLLILQKTYPYSGEKYEIGNFSTSYGSLPNNYSNMRDFMQEHMNKGYPFDTSESGGGTGDNDKSSDSIGFASSAVSDDVSEILTATSMWGIYKISQSGLTVLSSYLWSDDFFNTIKKNFQSPYENIVSLHMLPISVSGGAFSPVKIGGIETNASAYKITQTYADIDLGAITISEYWGNFLDYDATQVYIYLPFVGNQKIDTNKIMGRSIRVRYRVDILTGSFVCWLLVSDTKRAQGITHIIGSWTGNMALFLPLSQSNNTRWISALSSFSGAGSVTGALASGTMAMATASAATSLGLGHGDIQTASNYSSNMGFMGEMTPYVTIIRPEQQFPDNYQNYVGVPSFISSTVGATSGFTKVQEVHVDIATATETERLEIESLLKNGIIV